MTAKARQDIPEGATRPKAPAAPELPLMPSERRELLNKVRELEENQYMQGTIVLHEATRIIREADFLEEEQRDKLVELLWKNRKGQHP